MVGIRRGRQRPKPRPVILVELRMGISVGSAYACGIRAGHPAVMVASNGEVFSPHQEIADFARPKRTRNAVTQIDHTIDATVSDVGEDGFECRQVAVDVGNDSDKHRG